METNELSGRAPPSDDAPHLLVVDDDTRIRNLLKQYLTENGFRVSVAGTAAEARRKLEGLDFDLLVIDVMMPGENGMELTKSLRADRQVPILMLTALSEVENRISGLEAGADDYLPKPFDPRELILRINSILRRGGPQTVPKVEQIVFGP
jgi:two-component system phosphate regulon response regulator OmpR